MRLTLKNILLVLSLAGTLLAGCESLPIPLTFLQPTATLDPAAVSATLSAGETLTAMPTNTLTVTPSRTSTSTPTITRTPVATGTLAPLITLPAATRMPTLTKIPSLTPLPKPKATFPPVCDGGSLVTETVPDGTTFTPGANFIKTWRIKNAGTCTWTTAYTIVFKSGDKLGAPNSLPMPTTVAPGQTVDISIPMVAPMGAGAYKSYWLFKNASGTTFGVGGASNYTTAFFADIKVAGSAPSVGYDFTQNACLATWNSGAGTLPCPGIEGDSRGYVLPRTNPYPKLETGVMDTQSGLTLFPQYIDATTKGYIKGIYPAFAVKSGDIFQANFNCEYNNKACNVGFTLGYISGGTSGILWQGNQLYDGSIAAISVDLGSLDGKSVQFVFQIDANAASIENRAQILHPVIVRPPGTATPTPTGTPAPTVLVDFTSPLCATNIEWGSSALGGPFPTCPGTNGDPNGYALALTSAKLDDGTTYTAPSLLIAPPNAGSGFTIGVYAPSATPVTVQAGDRFAAIFGCEYGNTACDISFQLEYDSGSGPVTLLNYAQQHDGVVSVISDILTNIDPTLAGKTVTFRLIMNSSLIPSTQNRGILVSPAIVR